MWKMNQSGLSEGKMIFIFSLKLKKKQFAYAEQNISKLILHLAKK